MFVTNIKEMFRFPQTLSVDGSLLRNVRDMYGNTKNKYVNVTITCVSVRLLQDNFEIGAIFVSNKRHTARCIASTPLLSYPGGGDVPHPVLTGGYPILCWPGGGLPHPVLAGGTPTHLGLQYPSPPGRTWDQSLGYAPPPKRTWNQWKYDGIEIPPPQWWTAYAGGKNVDLVIEYCESSIGETVRCVICTHALLI